MFWSAASGGGLPCQQAAHLGRGAVVLSKSVDRTMPHAVIMTGAGLDVQCVSWGDCPARTCCSGCRPCKLRSMREAGARRLRFPTVCQAAHAPHSQEQFDHFCLWACCSMGTPRACPTLGSCLQNRAGSCPSTGARPSFPTIVTAKRAHQHNVWLGGRRLCCALAGCQALVHVRWLTGDLSLPWSIDTRDLNQAATSFAKQAAALFPCTARFSPLSNPPSH